MTAIVARQRKEMLKGASQPPRDAQGCDSVVDTWLCAGVMRTDMGSLNLATIAVSTEMPAFLVFQQSFFPHILDYNAQIPRSKGR